MPIQKQEMLGYGVVRFFPSRSASRGDRSALHKMNQEHLLVCSGPADRAEAAKSRPGEAGVEPVGHSTLSKQRTKTTSGSDSVRRPRKQWPSVDGRVVAPVRAHVHQAPSTSQTPGLPEQPSHSHRGETKMVYPEAPGSRALSAPPASLPGSPPRTLMSYSLAR